MTAESLPTPLSAPSCPHTRQRRRQRRTASTPGATIATKSTTSIMRQVVMLCLCLVSYLSLVQAQQTPTASASVSQSRQVHKYALPAFSMVLRVTVDQDEQQQDNGDDDEVYLDLEIFQETLEHVTQFHLTDIFQQHQHDYKDFHDEQFIRVQLSSKVRQEIVPDGEVPSREHVPLHAGFSGVVSYSFPSGAVPPTKRVEEAIGTVLEDALVAENYLLLFRRYLSSGALASIEDVYEIRIGTEQLTVLETNTKPLSDSLNNTPHPNNQGSNGNPSNTKKKHLNAVTIVAIVIFLTLSCLLMLFGATVVLLMKDRAKQERSLNGQTMNSIGMGTSARKRKTHNDEEQGDQDDDDDIDDEETTDTAETPAWKRAVLPVLRKAIMVRRYWKKHVRKQHKRSKHHHSKNGDPNNGGTSSDDSSNASPGSNDDDGLNDEDVYYDENLSDEEAANQWLDAWQASITSIPLRSVKNIGASDGIKSSPSKKHVKKKKASKMPLAPRPATRQSKKAFLCCIAEEDSVVDGASTVGGDLELGNDSVSSRKSKSKHHSTSPRELELDRIQELTSVVMDEDYPTASYGASARKKKQPSPPPPPPIETDVDLLDDMVSNGLVATATSGTTPSPSNNSGKSTSPSSSLSSTPKSSASSSSPLLPSSPLSPTPPLPESSLPSIEDVDLS